MKLFIIRHAPAVPASDTLLDPARPLTDEGRRRFVRAVRGLKRLEIRFERLLHSPWLRAMQTADLASELVHGETEVTEHLAEAPSSQLLERLAGDSVAVVGHEPWLGQLVAWLVVGSTEQGEAFALKKGAVVWLEGDPMPGKMVLRALLPPKVLRSLAAD